MQRRDRDRFTETEARELPDVGLASFVVDLVHRDDHRRWRRAAAPRATRASSSVTPVDDVDDEHDHVGGARSPRRPARSTLAASAGSSPVRPASPGASQPPVSTTRKRRPCHSAGELLAVARDARLLFDDRVALADDAVDERRLADVRPPDDRDDRELRRSRAERPRRATRRRSATISTGCGRSSTVVPSRKRPRDSATSGSR